MNKHTPGPWELQSWNKGQCQRIFAGFYYIGSADNSDFTDKQNMSNARLIAAAPDLIEACKLAMETIDAMLDVIGSKDCEPWSSDHNKEWQEFCNCYDALGAAKVKAVGDE